MIKFTSSIVQKIKECPIDIDYDKFQTEDFFAFEKENMLLIKFVKESNLEDIEKLLKYKHIW